MPKRVLIPLDGSHLADSVVTAILTLAGLLHVEVILLGVVQPTPLDAVGTSRGSLNHMVMRILAAALEGDVDIIVMPMQSRGGPGLHPFDVAEAVLRRARIPVVMVPPVEPNLAARTERDPERRLRAHAA